MKPGGNALTLSPILSFGGFTICQYEKTGARDAEEVSPAEVEAIAWGFIQFVAFRFRKTIEIANSIHRFHVRLEVLTSAARRTAAIILGYPQQRQRFPFIH